MQFYRLEFAPASSPSPGFAPRHLGLLQMRADQSPAAVTALRWVPGLGTILLAPGPSRVSLPVGTTNTFFSLSPESRSLRVAYGGLASRAGDTNTGPISFRIVACGPSQEERVLWSKVLSPPEQGSQTLSCQETIPLDLGGAQALAFETVQDRASQSFIPFWSGIGNDTAGGLGHSRAPMQ